MLAATTWHQTTWQGHIKKMSSGSFRLAIVIGVVVISLLGVIAFAVVLAGELTDRSIVVLTAILGFLGPTIASLLVLLRVEGTDIKVDNLHHDVLNGGLRDNVKRAIVEVEREPDLQEKRIESVAKGVQRDRHDLKNRRAGERARAQMNERVRQRTEGDNG